MLFFIRPIPGPAIWMWFQASQISTPTIQIGNEKIIPFDQLIYAWESGKKNHRSRLKRPTAKNKNRWVIQLCRECLLVSRLLRAGLVPCCSALRNGPSILVSLWVSNPQNTLVFLRFEAHKRIRSAGHPAMRENTGPPRFWTKILFLRWLLIHYFVGFIAVSCCQTG